MLDNKNIFFKKNILIYGLGKSGLAAYEFLKKKMKFIYMTIIESIIRILK